jgi:CheY-like chemotaxis protein
LPEGNYIYIEVEDDGCGMSEETLDKLFDPFFSTKFLGRGLGLPAVLGIVRGHKGAINVDSVPGKGTKITVLFPSSDLEVVKKEEKSEMVEFIPGRGTVLIIEDNEEVRKVVKNTIERFGYNVLLAANGKEGVKVFQDHTNTIDVILLDMTMPYLNGWETFLEIKKLNLRIPVLLTSGYSKDDVLKHFSGEKIFGFL